MERIDVGAIGGKLFQARLKMKKQKLLAKVLAGSKNVSFDEMTGLVEAFGFRLSRISGSHHIFVRDGVTELVNLQEVGGMAKSYQIRQFLKIVERYNLKIGDRS